MAGIIQQQMGQPTEQQEQQPAQGQPPNQQAVERVVIAATRIIHDAKIKPQLIALMKQAGDPVQALVEATTLVVKQLQEKSGRSIPGEVLGAAAWSVLQLVAELAQAAKLFTVTPELLQQAAKAGIEKFQQERAATQQPGAAPAPQPAPTEQPVAEGV
jgi:hypothetical protein